MTEPQAPRPPASTAHDPHDATAASDAFLQVNPQKGRSGLVRIVHAAGYSMAGLRAAWGEKAFRTEAILAIVLLPASIWLARGWRDWVLLIAPVLLLLITELLNSAIEAAIDRFGPEWHALSKKAKDMGSAAVFLALLLCAAVWLPALYERLLT
ncbi:MAG: diacylglycerol kinase [Comamonas sp.]